MKSKTTWEEEINELISYYNKHINEFDLMLDEMGFSEHLINKINELRKELINHLKKRIMKLYEMHSPHDNLIAEIMLILDEEK